MSRQIHFRPEAGAEVLEARRWYEERQPGLGARFAAAVEDVVERPLSELNLFPILQYDLPFPSQIDITDTWHKTKG